jgi:hypothetical protein
MTNVLARGTTTILGLLSGTLQDDDRAESLTFSRTPDGTSIITNSADNQVRTFIVYARLNLPYSATDEIVLQATRLAG